MNIFTFECAQQLLFIFHFNRLFFFDVQGFLLNSNVYFPNDFHLDKNFDCSWPERSEHLCLHLFLLCFSFTSFNALSFVIFTKMCSKPTIFTLEFSQMHQQLAGRKGKNKKTLRSPRQVWVIEANCSVTKITRMMRLSVYLLPRQFSNNNKNQVNSLFVMRLFLR